MHLSGKGLYTCDCPRCTVSFTVVKRIQLHGAAPEITRELKTEPGPETDATPAVKAEDEAETFKETSSAKVEEAPSKVESRGMICKPEGPGHCCVSSHANTCQRCCSENQVLALL